MTNQFHMDTFIKQTRATQCRSPETLISDISDSACSQMQRRKDDVIESPPAFLMNDQGPPSVIYDRTFLTIDNSMSFQTSYSAAMTEARTTKTTRTMCTTYSADVTEIDGQDKDDYNTTADVNQEDSVHLSVIQEDDDNGFEVGYDDHSSCRSEESGKKDDSKYSETGLCHERIDSTKKEISLGEVDKTPTESRSTSPLALTSTNSMASSNDKSGAATKDSVMPSFTLADTNKTPNSSTSSSNRFLSRGLAKRFQMKTSEQDITISNATSLELADGSKDGSFSLFTLETTYQQGFDKFRDWPRDVNNTFNRTKNFENDSLISDDKILESQQDFMHEYGFEIMGINSSTSASEYTGTLSIFAPSHLPRACEKSNSEDALNAPDTSAIKPDHIRNASSQDGNTPVEVVRSTAEANLSTKHRNKTDKAIEQEDTSTFESSLSHVTLSTEALTEKSFMSSSSFVQPSSEPKKFNLWLLAKMFTCGPSSTSCEGEKIQEQCYSPIEENYNSDESSYESDEQDRTQSHCLSLSLRDQDFDESLNIEVPLETATDAVAGNYEDSRTTITSKVIGKTKFYPGFEITDKDGKPKVTTNSRSREINEMASKLGLGQKLSRKKESTARPKKQSIMESLAPRRRQTREKNKQNSNRKNKRSILERIDVQVRQNNV